MIIGVGVDLVEISRIKSMLDKESKNNFSFVFTTDEMELYRKRKNNPAVLAGNFALKEAVAKSFGTGFEKFKPSDIEVLRDEKGKPYVNLFGNAKKIAESLGITSLHASISNTEVLAIGYVIAETFEKEGGIVAN